MASVFGIKLLDIFDLNLSRRAATGLTGLTYFYMHISQNPTDTCLYRIRVDSKDTWWRHLKCLCTIPINTLDCSSPTNSLWTNTEIYSFYLITFNKLITVAQLGLYTSTHLCFYCSVRLPDKTEKNNINTTEIAITVLQLLDQFYSLAIQSLKFALE